MEGFDILYLMKTPFFMGNTSIVPTEANQCDVNEEDNVNMTEKNLLLLRALTVLNDIEGLKALIQNLMSTEGPQKANAQGFTVLAQYLMQKVRSLSSFLFIPGVFLNTLLSYLLRKLTKTSSTTAFSSLRPVQSR